MLRVPLRLTVFCSFLWVLSAFPQSTPKAVIVNWHGVNYPAHITAVENGRYHIRYDEHREGRADEEWVDVKRLKNSDYSPFRADAANLATTPPAKATSGYATAAPASLPTGLYSCTMFISGTGLVNNGEFTLYPDGTYERGGSRGRYAYASATGRVTFQGGVMDGRAAQYEARQLPTLHLKGNAGNVLAKREERNVADCERK